VKPAARELLDRIYATGKVEDADGAEREALPAGVPREHADELARLVAEEGAGRTLETGMAYGLSTLAICGAGAREHVAVDPLQSSDWGGIGILNLRRAGLEEHVRVIEEPSETALPRLAANGPELDLALIDGLHLFDHTLIDFFYADRMLRDGGVLVFHDTWMPAVAQAVAYVETNRAYERVQAGDAAMAVLRRTGGDARAWDFHRDFMPRRGFRQRVRG
jgi:predicted O-methyltransferase YrrM